MNQESVSFFKPVRTAVVVLLVVGALCLAAVTISYVRQWAVPVERPNQSTIYTSGKGEAFAVPDIATFSFTVEEEGVTVKAAQDKATQKMNSVLAYLKNQKIDDKDIKTTSYNANPKYEYQRVTCVAYPCPASKQVLVGYQVSQSVQVKVRDTDKAGAVLSGVGAFNVQYVSGLQFTVDDQDAIIAQAREKAITDAKAKAEILARDLGVTLVRIISFSDEQDNQSYYSNELRTDAVGKGAAPQAANVPMGENKYVSNVTITYEIR